MFRSALILVVFFQRVVGHRAERGLFAGEDLGILAGRVVDKSRSGVAGARVWALAGSGEACKAVAETVTDEDGRFHFNAFWADPARPGFTVVTLLARDLSGRTGWRSNVYVMNPPVDPIEVDDSVELQGRVIDQAGHAIAVLASRCSRPCLRDRRG